MKYYSPHQIKYYAMDISRRMSVADTARFTNVLMEARVDLNPHQVDAALFAFSSPLSRGAILADEVGLGKTIEAGIILSQLWAEHKRHILIIVPASLRSQWNIELMEKFYLPSIVLERKLFDRIAADGMNPFDTTHNIVICSYNFFERNAEIANKVLWDLIVMDEAHRLRNVYMKSNIIGNSIKKHLKPFKKLLLTATPLQNNLKELYGLISLIDEHFFTSASVFSERYNAVTTRDSVRYGELRSRLKTVIHRTLRKQVQEYVNYTKRSALVCEYTPSISEQMVYRELNEYLLRDFSYGIPQKSKALMTLQLRKIMGSSCFALGFTLDKIIKRLEDGEKSGRVMTNHNEDFDDEFFDETTSTVEVLDPEALHEEIIELKKFRKDVSSVGVESKAIELLSALAKGFDKMKRLGAQQKALVFTESRRTQEYLQEFLCANGFKNGIVCFNGTNNGPEADLIYNNWKNDRDNINRSTGNPIIDRKQALVDYFRHEGIIMIATEAGAEGINLQFCSLVVNYDMPWNPQRIEQRIGRCHRYGQKHDVVVINFVNTANQAELRIYELLSSKFNLFNGVFGSSDEVLGSIESGIDFEKHLNSILQNCRREEDIQHAFDLLQTELEEVINSRIRQTKEFLLENFDEDVISKLRVHQENNKALVNTYQRHFWRILGGMLHGCRMDEGSQSFTLTEDCGLLKAATYTLNKHSETAIYLRASSNEGREFIRKAKEANTPDAEIIFNLSGYKYNVSVLSPYKGHSGYCRMVLLSSDNTFDSEEFIFFCCIDETNRLLPDELGMKLMELPVLEYFVKGIDLEVSNLLHRNIQTRLLAYKDQLEERSNIFVNEEIDKIMSWGEEELTPLEDEIKVLDKEMRNLKSNLRRERDAKLRISLMSVFQSKLRVLDQKRQDYRTKRENLEMLLDNKYKTLSMALTNDVKQTDIFTIHWKIV